MISRFLKQVKLAKLLNSDKNSFIQNDFHCFYFNLSVPQDNEIKVKIMISIEFFIDVFISFALYNIVICQLDLTWLQRKVNFNKTQNLASHF